jgi:hypothetical protein
MSREILNKNNYSERLIKLVPAEWISAYIAIKGILDSNTNAGMNVYFFVISIQFILLPAYLRFALDVRKVSQIALTSISFLVWVFSLGGTPFGGLGWYESYYGSIALILWTLAIPIWKCDSTSDAREP